MAGERLIYLPLGGAGEIGMNAYIYGYGRPGKERLLLVDLGVAFPDMDSSPGVEVRTAHGRVTFGIGKGSVQRWTRTGGRGQRMRSVGERAGLSDR